MGAEDLFCHVTSLEPGESLGPGDKVSFVEENNERTGKSEAINVKVLERGTGVIASDGPSESAVEMKGQMVRWNSEEASASSSLTKKRTTFSHISVLLKVA